MHVTFATVQNTVLTKHFTSSGGGILVGEKIYSFLEKNLNVFINKFL
jgi:hypothetical protein